MITRTFQNNCIQPQEIMAVYYKQFKDIMKKFSYISFNLKCIQEFNDKNYSTIVIIPELVLNTTLSQGGSIKAKMFTLSCRQEILEDEVYIKGPVGVNSQDIPTFKYQVEAELLNDDIMEQLGVQTVRHARLAINSDITLLISRFRERVVYPASNYSLNTEVIYQKAMEIGSILGINDFIHDKCNIGRVSGSAIVIDAGYDINPLKPLYYKNADNLKLNIVENEIFTRRTQGKQEVGSARSKWLKELNGKAKVLIDSPDKERKKLGKKAKEFLSEKGITPNLMRVKINIKNMKSQTYKGNLSASEVKKLEGFVSYIQAARHKAASLNNVR